VSPPHGLREVRLLPSEERLLSLLVESKTHLQRMQQAIPLTDEELAAVEGDLTATEQLIAGLAAIPTPAGPTPQQLGAWAQNVIALGMETT